MTAVWGYERDHTTGPYFVACKASSQPHIIFLHDPSFHLRKSLENNFLPFNIPTKMLYVIRYISFISPMFAKFIHYTIITSITVQPVLYLSLIIIIESPMQYRQLFRDMVSETAGYRLNTSEYLGN
jgi:hypothetical protein